MADNNTVIVPPQKHVNSRLNTEGLTEEQKQRLIKDRRNAYYREKRAKAKREREAKRAAEGYEKPRKVKYMYFTIKPNDIHTTYEDAMEFRKSLSEICLKHKFHGKETLERHYAVHLENLENQDFFVVQYPTKKDVPN